MNRDLPHKTDSAAIWRWLLAGYWLAICVATHVPAHLPSLPTNQLDKLVHASMFAGLAFLLAMAWDRSTGTLTRRHLRYVWLALMLYAIADELTQPWFHRTASVFDWLADAVGAAAGLVVFAKYQRQTDKSSTP